MFGQLLPGKVFTRLGVDDFVGEIEAWILVDLGIPHDFSPMREWQTGQIVVAISTEFLCMSHAAAAMHLKNL